MAYRLPGGAQSDDFHPRQRRQVVFQVEVADTPAKRAMGLQYRRELADDRGMIFLFPGESPQTFWMKNTPIPLDMIFINRERKIVGIVEQTVPFSARPALGRRAEPVRAGNQRRAGETATAFKPATASASTALRPTHVTE